GRAPRARPDPRRPEHGARLPRLLSRHHDPLHPLDPARAPVAASPRVHDARRDRVRTSRGRLIRVASASIYAPGMPISPYLERLRRRVGKTLLLVPSVTAVVRDRRRRVLVPRHAAGGWGAPGGSLCP